MTASESTRTRRQSAACHASRQWRWCAAAARGDAAGATRRRTTERIALAGKPEPMLVLPVMPFPAINPVLISVGPLAVRWYALAYIVGIIAGWFYARAIIASERLWGGPAPLTVARFRRFRHLDHARHHPRRPHRLCAVLQSAAFSSPIRSRSSSFGTAACRSTAASLGCIVAIVAVRAAPRTFRCCRSAT